MVSECIDSVVVVLRKVGEMSGVAAAMKRSERRMVSFILVF